MARPKFPQTLKNHDFGQLLVLSGLYAEFDDESGTSVFKTHWLVVNTWDEDSRHLTGKKQDEAQNFLTAMNEISQWI